MPDLQLTAEVLSALEWGAHLAISVSGGKDSSAMFWALVQAHREQGWQGDLLAIHADLGRAEWGITQAHIQRECDRAGVPLRIVHHTKGDLIDGIRRRMATRPDAPPFPSSAARWCTSDYKRSVISREIRNLWPSNALVINAMGLRGDESRARSKRPVEIIRDDCTAWTKGRVTWDWNPIHHWSTEDVLSSLGYPAERLAAMKAEAVALPAGTDPVQYLFAKYTDIHPAYALGNQRLSCAMCVLASTNDIMNGALHQPETYRELCDIEIESGFSFKQGQWLGTLRPELLRPDQLIFYEGKQ